MSISEERRAQHIERSKLTSARLKESKPIYFSDDWPEGPRPGYIDLHDTPICDFCLCGFVWEFRIDTPLNYEPMFEAQPIMECAECYEIVTVQDRRNNMGVYGTSAPLDANDIDYDDDGEESYIECTNCEEEFTEDELSTLNMNGTWQNNVCDDCKQAYEDRLEELLEEARDRADEEFRDGYVIKSTYRR